MFSQKVFVSIVFKTRARHGGFTRPFPESLVFSDKRYYQIPGFTEINPTRSLSRPFFSVALKRKKSDFLVFKFLKIFACGVGKKEKI